MLRVLVHVCFNVAVYGALLFVPAGTVDWWRAWVVLALVFAGMLVTRFWALRGKEGLLEERRRSPLQAGQPRGDKLLVLGFVTIFPAYIAFIPLDVFRFHLLGRPDALVGALGLGLCVAGWLLISLAFRENAFAAAIVKEQDERGQIVVDTGVYMAIRHPLYAGVDLIVIGLPLWLQSYAAAIVSIVPLTLVLARIVVEEAFLRERLLGYTAYAARVRHRLIPRIW